MTQSQPDSQSAIHPAVRLKQSLDEADSRPPKEPLSKITNWKQLYDCLTNSRMEIDEIQDLWQGPPSLLLRMLRGKRLRQCLAAREELALAKCRQEIFRSAGQVGSRLGEMVYWSSANDGRRRGCREVMYQVKQFMEMDRRASHLAPGSCDRGSASPSRRKRVRKEELAPPAEPPGSPISRSAPLPVAQTPLPSAEGIARVACGDALVCGESHPHPALRADLSQRERGRSSRRKAANPCDLTKDNLTPQAQEPPADLLYPVGPETESPASAGEASAESTVCTAEGTQTVPPEDKESTLPAGEAATAKSESDGIVPGAQECASTRKDAQDDWRLNSKNPWNIPMKNPYMDSIVLGMGRKMFRYPPPRGIWRPKPPPAGQAARDQQQEIPAGAQDGM